MGLQRHRCMSMYIDLENPLIGIAFLVLVVVIGRR